MPFWWVNHKQTFKEETSGGYIWSPKTSSNGARNPTYINLTLTHPGDVVFSYANKKIAAIGVVAAPCAEQGKPEEFGNRGENWQQSGWVVPIDWVSLPVPWVPSDYIDEFKHLLPSVHSPLRPDGNGNQGCYLASISDELGSLLLGWLGESNPSQVVEYLMISRLYLKSILKKFLSGFITLRRVLVK